MSYKGYDKLKGRLDSLKYEYDSLQSFMVNYVLGGASKLGYVEKQVK